MIGFEKNAKRKISVAMYNRLVRLSPSLGSLLTRFGKESITELGAVDSGELRDDFTASVTPTNSRGIVLRMVSTVPHGIFVVLGLGSNRKKGPRNYFYKAADKFLRFYGIKGFNRSTKQPLSYTELAASGKSFSIKTRTKKGANSLKTPNSFKSKTRQTKPGVFSTRFTPKK